MVNVMTHSCRSRRADVLAAAVVLFAFAAAAPAQAPAAEPDNAALYYFKAAALLQQPQTTDDLTTVIYVDRALDRLPPRIFSARPDCLQWLLAERPMLGALDAASRIERCAFPTAVPGEASLDLSHLPRMLAVLRRALAASKAFEYADNAPGAAVIYGDVFAAVRHLDQDGNMASGRAAIELLQRIVFQFEGFATRKTPADALSRLGLRLKDAPETLFHPGLYLRNDASRNAEWLLSDPERAVERIGRLYGNAQVRPAVDQLVTLEPELKAQRLRTWVSGYLQQVDELASAMELPYRLAMPKLRDIDASKVADERDPKGGPNPLATVLVPHGSELYQLFLLAEAQYDMADLLCAAALFHAESGAWPARIEEIEQFTHRRFENDPFSGAPYYYKLRDNMPVIIARVPRWMADQPDLIYTLELASRLKIDGDRYDAAVQTIQDEKKSAEAAAKRKAAGEAATAPWMQ